MAQWPNQPKSPKRGRHAQTEARTDVITGLYRPPPVTQRRSIPPRGNKRNHEAPAAVRSPPAVASQVKRFPSDRRAVHPPRHSATARSLARPQSRLPSCSRHSPTSPRPIPPPAVAARSPARRPPAIENATMQRVLTCEQNDDGIEMKLILALATTVNITDDDGNDDGGRGPDARRSSRSGRSSARKNGPAAAVNNTSGGRRPEQPQTTAAVGRTLSGAAAAASGRMGAVAAASG